LSFRYLTEAFLCCLLATGIFIWNLLTFFKQFSSNVFLVRALKAVVPKLVRAITQTKAAIMSYYPQYCAVIADNTEQRCYFGSALPPKESHTTPRA